MPRRERIDYDPDTGHDIIVVEEVELDEDGNVDRVVEIVDIREK